MTFPRHTTVQSARGATSRNWLLYLGLFSVYLVLRCLAWRSTLLLEDHDSVFYLYQIRLFLDFDLLDIINSDPDSTPFYPFLGALCSLPGWSVEFGARLCSLVLSSTLFLAVAGIGKRISNSYEVAIGLLILSLSPVMVFLSISVLTEPSYVALVYLGFWLFLTQYESPAYWKSTVLGMIFGLAFLTRTEGLLYIAVIPILQWAHFLFVKPRQCSFRRLIGWSSIFIVFFLALAIPQIWRVSKKMGTFAINGRQAWMTILNNPDGKSFEEKIYGLDFSSKTVNLDYILNHPGALSQYNVDKNIKYYLGILKNFSFNLNRLYQRNLGILIGPIGISFFVLGLLALLSSGRPFESFLVSAFIAVALVAPLLYNVAIRHIAIIAPVLFTMEGLGIVYLYRWVRRRQHSRFLMGFFFIPLCLFHFTAGMSYPLLTRFSRPLEVNSEYRPDELREPVRVIKHIEKNKLLRSPNIAARKNYLAYYAGGNPFPTPYTTYEGLARYCHINNIDFLYLQHRLLRDYPFLAIFSGSNSAPHFSLLHQSKDHCGGNIELYRFDSALGRQSDRP
jgi:hypothetical protein